MKQLLALTAALGLALAAATPAVGTHCDPLTGERVGAPPCSQTPPDLCCSVLGPQTGPDTDVDGFPDRCDGDYNQDCIVGAPDYILFEANVFPAPYNALMDHDGVAPVGVICDFLFFSEMFSFQVDEYTATSDCVP
jgi:hypothetical protein